MSKFRNYEVVTPKFKSWDTGIRIKLNPKYSLFNFSKPGSWFWKDDSPYWKVCLTSKIEEEFFSNSAFTVDMTWDDAVEYGNLLWSKLK
jgi:hypothetical protein